MKKLCLLAGFLAAGIHYAQIRFEKGYFINNSGERKEVLIKNLDWKNNPVDFEYRTDNSSEIKKENINNVKEFSIDGNRKYIRATVMVDRSSTNLNSMSENRAPDLKEETLFLKYIIEGKAGLLYYEDGNIRRFFYNAEKSEPEQLIYKAYYIDQGSVGYNEDYKKQIAEHLKCGINSGQLQNVNYTTKDLTKIFTQYNQCSGDQITDYAKSDTKKNLFHLNIRPGVNFSSFETTHNYSYESVNTDFGKDTSFRIGLEFEYVLPFNKNKWALFAEPTYQYYKGSKEITENEGSYFEYKYTATTDYKSIELPLGVRHYFFLDDRSKIFLNAAYVIDFNLSSSIKFDRNELEVSSGNNFVFGAGYKYNDKFSAEIRVGTSRTLLRDYVSINSDYKAISVILGYTLF
ncbi:tRNA modification GTPase [Chryseobacterium phosphatilyticum]|uniref:tRNA modification GTPase n=1 Tax=Chryseobacterium phosphatilyticum TaxID=475075 RepID=A0A316X581_9FLAO|nr:PorT family protein [Chryseobacterium phosphatilyticum]PWN68951.1 tRNA modification GTPase [Chryseobacterium phosphatilyticum]